MPKAYDPFDEIRREAADPDLIPPETVAENAAQGLAWRKQFGRGGTAVGAGIASGLVARTPISPQTIKRMVSYFARHAVDKRGKNFDNDENPSAGRIAWLLWGGDAGRDWAVGMRETMRAR